MMNKKFKRYNFWKVFWVVLGLYLILGLIGIIAVFLTPSTATNNLHWKEILTKNTLIDQFFKFTFTVAFFYFSLNTYYRFISEKKGTIYFIRYSIIIAIIFTTFYLCCYTFISQKDKLQKELTTGLLIFSFALSTLFNIGISLLIAYLTYLRDEKKQRKILEEQKMQLEVEKSQANFNFLKAQINPHFLHNTLNFLYAKSLPYSPELSEGILTLSDIMRYALSEGNTKNGKAPLKDEIEHVRNVIKIQQLRFSNKLNVHFDVEGVLNGATIIPFVLITLVENAFKHGDLKTNEYPVIIKLSITDKLYFYCSNKKATGPKELSTGIGLDNIKKRLELAYGKNYSLDVMDDGEVYTTALTINEL